MTPAQAYGHPDWITDFPVQGPTDPGIRAADCWYAKNRLPVNNPACADCKGPVPMWATTKGTGLSEAISYGGSRVAGFGVGAVMDPPAVLSADLQAWMMNALNDLNTKIVSSTGTTCATWGADLKSMTGCFQTWYNANRSPASKTLRTDGVVDQDTFDAMKSVAAAHPADFPSLPAALPATPMPSLPAAPVAPAAKKGLSTGATVGIAAAGAAVIGAGIYYVTRKKKKGSRR